MLAYKSFLRSEGWGPPISGEHSDSDEDEDEDEDEGEETGEGFDYIIAADGPEKKGSTAAPNKRSWMFDQQSGLTDANWGLSALIATLLEPYRVAIVRLQTTGQPISHRVNREIEGLLTTLKNEWINQGIAAPFSADIPNDMPGPDSTHDDHHNLYRSGPVLCITLRKTDI